MRACVAVLLLAGCLNEAEPVNEDDQAVLDVVRTGAYKGEGFTRINQVPYESAASNNLINVYASIDSASAYAQITPETEELPTSLPIGTMIVRELLDSSGNTEGLTVMQKRALDYNPELDGYFFALTTASGQRTNIDGVVQWGPLESCMTCHIARESTGYLFGVPLTMR